MNAGLRNNRSSCSAEIENGRVKVPADPGLGIRCGSQTWCKAEFVRS